MNARSSLRRSTVTNPFRWARALVVFQPYHTYACLTVVPSSVPPFLLFFFACPLALFQDDPRSRFSPFYPNPFFIIARVPMMQQANVAIGDEWSMKVSLPPVSFGVGRPVRAEMVDAINLALDEDVKYEIPKNYLRGEGDSELSRTYMCVSRDNRW